MYIEKGIFGEAFQEYELVEHSCSYNGYIEHN